MACKSCAERAAELMAAAKAGELHKVNTLLQAAAAGQSTPTGQQVVVSTNGVRVVSTLPPDGGSGG